MLYELKVVASLTGEHESQCLHYAMLQGVPLAKLINFGEPKVRGKLLRNAISTTERYQITIQRSAMRLITPRCENLLTYLEEILRDWGTCLSSYLYSDAITSFFGGESRCVQRVQLQKRGLLLGTHRVQCHSDGAAFVVTSFPADQTAYAQHLRVLLDHTSLKAIQWINLNRSVVEIITVD